jgi:hypothetical protein
VYLPKMAYCANPCFILYADQQQGTSILSS